MPAADWPYVVTEYLAPFGDERAFSYHREPFAADTTACNRQRQVGIHTALVRVEMPGREDERFDVDEESDRWLHRTPHDEIRAVIEQHGGTASATDSYDELRTELHRVMWGSRA